MASARISVAVEKRIGTISPEIYGHFAEHLGGVIYDGIWVGPGSGVPNIKGIRKDLVNWMKRIRPGVIRWPGGCFADKYHWMDGIGPREKRPAKVKGTYRVRGVTSEASFSATVPARGRTTVRLSIRIPSGVPAGLSDLLVTASADGQPMASLATPVRLSRGQVVEFLANSALDEQYLTGDERGGGAPSVRFGSRWTYRIPVAAFGQVRISGLVGAHNSGPWSILASDDGKEFHPVLSGRSGKSWHHAVRKLPGGVLWLRLEGTDVQLGELVIESQQNR